MPSLLRQPFDGSTLGRLGARKELHRRMVAGGIDPTGDQKRRLDAWAKVSVAGGPTLAMNMEGYEGRYLTGVDNKPIPSLLKVSITRVTGYAPKINLTVEVEVDFEVYSHSQFEYYARHYLRRHPDKAPVTIQFGNVQSFDGRGRVSHTLTGARIIAGTYSTSDLNVYQCKFKAIAPATAIKDLDMFSHRPLEFVFPGQKFIYGNLSTKREGVGNIIKKIIYDLQEGGDKRTSNFPDGHEPVSPDFGIVGKIYHPFKGSPIGGSGVGGFVRRLFNDESSGEETDAIEYVSLEYMVKLINKVIVDYAKEKSAQQIPFEIKFSDSPYSFLPTTYLGHFRSGNPIGVLFLGLGDSGNYEIGGKGKNFQIGGGSFNSCVQGRKMDHRKILLSRRLVIAPLIEAIQKFEEDRKKGRDSIQLTEISDQTLSLESFFNTMFQAISRASGHFVSLSFSVPKDIYGADGATKMAQMEIIDSQYVENPANQVYEFDPLNGDGNTLQLNIVGKLPSDLVALSLVHSVGMGSKTSAIHSEDQSDPTDVMGELILKLTSLEEDFGVFAKMADDQFDSASVQEACSAYVELNKIIPLTDGSGAGGFTEYFDIEIQATMEGVFPIITGNLFTASNLPSFAKLGNKIAFVALDIEDVISSPNEWNTNVRCRMTPYL